MMDFIYQNKTELLFGKDKEYLVGERIGALGGKNVLICFGQGSVIKSGLLKKVEECLEKAGLKFFEYGGVCANPSKSHAVEGIKIAKEKKADFILALGGGSVIDEAKFIAAGVKNDDIWSYYKNGSGEKLKAALPIAVILTIPAAGSEGSVASVIRDDTTGKKYSLQSEVLRPRLTFINPEYCFTLPKNQIANGASDILAHLMERYFTPLQDVELTDNLLIGAMRSVLKIAVKVFADNLNYQYWSELCLLGTLAHNGMLSLGRDIQDWGTHNIENKLLSGVCNIAHGTGLAIIFPAWLKYVSKTKKDKILQFAKQVFDAKGATDSEIIANGIASLENFYRSLDLPTSLSEVGINADDIKNLVEQVYDKNTVLGGYGKLNTSDIMAIIGLAK